MQIAVPFDASLLMVSLDPIQEGFGCAGRYCLRRSPAYEAGELLLLHRAVWCAHSGELVGVAGFEPAIFGFQNRYDGPGFTIPREDETSL